MFAIEIIANGQQNVLNITKKHIPSFSKQEVLIKVAYAGINRADILQKKGYYKPDIGITNIPGLEVSGTIIDGDLENSSFSIGDKVCALLEGGGYAEYCIASLNQCLPLPKNITLLDAAGLPEICFTVWHNLVKKCSIKSGQSILIHGGTSGIGTFAIQLAKLFGCYVFSTVGSNTKANFAKNLGADIVINYNIDDFEDKINKITNKVGVNCILDIVSGHYISKNINILSYDGCMSIISMLSGNRYTNIDVSLLLKRRLTIFGNTLRSQPKKIKSILANDIYNHIWPSFDKGFLKPITYACFPFEKVNEAHALMESSQHIGKIILSM
ncbi:Phthiocerol/phenolphthiocerol synthesis polyketide synthase type I PpsC [Candidatus Kinetoplastibacterium sorsogonicusi]|uniref:Phthiocerol/phenolphthiocerol synthesis polyketide synthase type I PpsC n=1 Tax=Candidatus Kinetoplastidibacterium kentomonadis TaxID=1576550 RepID=A0A3S7JA94_9PROT|nr:NAD(P)H-quinone oxidoreductase [Candidatus Kinetoplastibacterium sorsogonicusi]AWD32600.1 Phthiocerol/phenolphthiocerol synthesis polyketide synthase type I PpsC [Candidatus Kinetoplastibacterium sorsogonicusi]